MATTVASDLIVPEVWGPMVMKATLAKAAMAPLADQDNTLQGNPGDSIKFPSYGYIGDAVDLAETDAIVPVKLETGEDGVAIKEAGKGVELTDKAVLTAMGQPTDEAVRQLALSIARKIDADLIASAYATNTAHTGTSGTQAGGPLRLPATLNQLDWRGFTLGAGLLGDEWDPAEMRALVIHSAQQTDLLNDPNFIGMDKFGANSVVLRGQIGSLGTVPIIVSDRVRVTGTANDRVYESFLVRRGALMLAYKRQALIERDRDILRRTTVVTANVHYATKRTDNRGVIVVPTYAPTANGNPTTPGA